MKVYGSRISYYTGKLECYLRFKGIDYQPLPMPYDQSEMLKEKVGAVQMPIVDDAGKWMSDTTPILEYLETQHPQNSIIPDDPVVAFIAFLIEDYADEWLWRPAMYYRWWYRDDRNLASSVLTDELTGHVKAPRWMRRRMIVRRQVKHYVHRDGITPTTRFHAEETYTNALTALTAMLETRPYLLGDAPSIADFGMIGPMFRHFGQDPTPQEIMRQKAPVVYEWVARMWSARANKSAALLSTVPEDAQPLLREACECHLGQLAANAKAYAAQQPRFDMTIQGTTYRSVATSQYRVWCLEELRRRFAELDRESQAKVKALLPFEHADLLWTDTVPAVSGFNVERHLPFGKALNVFEGGLP
ncbi:MAG: glutathione S-transferase family protein [Pseudomonadota bacterium]